jgi:hypothetical protein
VSEKDRIVKEEKLRGSEEKMKVEIKKKTE